MYYTRLVPSQKRMVALESEKARPISSCMYRIIIQAWKSLRWAVPCTVLGRALHLLWLAACSYQEGLQALHLLCVQFLLCGLSHPFEITQGIQYPPLSFGL